MLVIIKRETRQDGTQRFQAYQVTSNNQEVNLYIGSIWPSETIKNVKNDLGQNVKIVCQY